MAQSMRQTASDQYENADQLNRTIAQDAQTDQELESQVPPVSRYGTIWRVAADPNQPRMEEFAYRGRILAFRAPRKRREAVGRAKVPAERPKGTGKGAQAALAGRPGRARMQGRKLPSVISLRIPKKTTIVGKIQHSFQIA